MFGHDLQSAGEAFIVLVAQSQITLDLPVAITMVASIVSPLALAVVTLFKLVVSSRDDQIADLKSERANDRAQLERANKQADEATAALREAVREGHRTLSLAERTSDR